MSTSVPVWEIVITVTESIVEVFVLCLAGLLLARVGITDKVTQRKINRLNISLFTPCLLFSKVAFTLTPAKLKELWIVPVGFMVVTGVSMFVAWAMGKAFRLKKTQISFAMAASGFMNSNSLPIALVQSLVVEVKGLKWGNDDTKEAMLGRALTYLILYSTLGMMLRWSYGVHLLTQADDEAEPLVEDPEATGDATAATSETTAVEDVSTPLLSEGGTVQRGNDRKRNASTSSVGSAIRSGMATDEEDPWANVPGANSGTTVGANVRATPGPFLAQQAETNPFAHGRPAPQRKLSAFASFPNSPDSSTRALSTNEEGDEDEDDEEAEDPEWGSREGLIGRGRRTERTTSRWSSAIRRTGGKVKRFFKVLNEFMTVPMWSALLSIFIAMVPPLQAKLSTVRPLREAIKSAGQCSIPLTLVVLGAYFYTPAPALIDPPRSITHPAKDNRWFKAFRRDPTRKAIRELAAKQQPEVQRPGETRTVFVAVMARMVVTPLILLPLIALFAWHDTFEAAEDPVFILTAVLIISSPPAITLAQITQAASGDAFERLISKTIWVSYAVLVPPLTLLYVVLGLFLSRL